SEIYQAAADILILDKDAPALEQYTQSKLIASDGRMRSEFSSQLVGAFMRGVSIRPIAGADQTFCELVVERGIKIKIETLKHLNYLLTIMSPRLKVVEYRGYEVVKAIFETLDGDDGSQLMPDDVQRMYDRLRDTDSKRRVICDFIAGMTDRYAVEFYSRLKESGASIFKPL
ncbi:MAG: deoxyguanosinetriphosphate triphosphohydrolase, partial [Caldisericota bacterium]|nr:deoxyguanosinetriphosphate triphosphohydrolase [Caldisericota bacterium]